MQILNLINKEKGDINYSLSKFPDGEVQITLGEFSHKDRLTVMCRITSPEELFILTQVMDILDRHGMLYEVEIYYLMTMRMDRVMDFNRPFSLEIISKMLKLFNAQKIYILEPHSNRILWDTHLFRELFLPEISQARREFFDTYQIVFPDSGARYNNFDGIYPAVFCSKVRDSSTGKLSGFEVENPQDIKGDNLLIFDDLCDGGGTFCGIASEIKKIKPDAKLSIYVTHMVNPKGIENLSKNFNHVWFTNSYKTWENLPDNVTQIEIV